MINMTFTEVSWQIKVFYHIRKKKSIPIPLTLEDQLASFNIHKVSYPRSQICFVVLPKTDWKVYLDDILCKHLTLKHQKHPVLLSKGNI